jgi:hypothetical protein
MRFAALTLIGSLALAAAPLAANAAPAIPAASAPVSANLVQVAFGCGPAYHPNAWGYCVPNYYGYGYAGWPGYVYYGPHYWGGYHHWYHWHH